MAFLGETFNSNDKTKKLSRHPGDLKISRTGVEITVRQKPDQF